MSGSEGGKETSWRKDKKRGTLPLFLRPSSWWRESQRVRSASAPAGWSDIETEETPWFSKGTEQLSIPSQRGPGWPCRGRHGWWAKGLKNGLWRRKTHTHTPGYEILSVLLIELIWVSSYFCNVSCSCSEGDLMTGNKLHLLNKAPPSPLHHSPNGRTVHLTMLTSRLYELDSFANLAYF